MLLPFNDAARLVLRLADLEARSFRHDSIGTEQLLLALVQLHGCVAARVLAKAKIERGIVRIEVEWIVPPGSASTTDEKLPLAPNGQKSIELASAAAVRLHHAEIGTGHLLLGLLEEAQGVAFQVLCKLKIGRLGENLSRVAEHVIDEMSRGFPPLRCR